MEGLSRNLLCGSHKKEQVCLQQAAQRILNQVKNGYSHTISSETCLFHHANHKVDKIELIGSPDDLQMFKTRSVYISSIHVYT